MAITPKAVQELREKTGVGMMDCKRALEEAVGDMEEAVKILRKKGIATAEKKSMRAASDGLIVAFVTADGHTGALLEVNCETDFVAKTDDFQGLAAALCAQVAEKDPADVAALLEQACIAEDPATKVKDLIVAKVAKLGENIQLRRFIRYHGDAAFSVSYIHAGGKIGVLMECEAPAATDEIEGRGQGPLHAGRRRGAAVREPRRGHPRSPGEREGDLPRPGPRAGQAREHRGQDRRGQDEQVLRGGLPPRAGLHQGHRSQRAEAHRRARPRASRWCASPGTSWARA